MSVFEIIMLICFGAAWPVSIYKTWTCKSVSGKSMLFMIIILAGYASGMLHKIFYSRDIVFFLYLMNFVMVSIDLGLYLNNRRRQFCED